MENRAERLSAELRKRAEDWLASRGSRATNAQSDVLRLVHELEVYEIELEMQNEALQAARHEAESSKQRYAELFDFAPIGYVVLQDGVVQNANLESARMLGTTCHALSGQRFEHFVGTECRKAFAEFLARAAAPGDDVPSESCEVRLSVPADEPRDMRLVGRGLGDARESRTLVAMLDITERNRATAELRQARTAAESASAAKSEFLSSMSHELRTPLNAILGFTQLLARDKREPLSERHKERVLKILEGGEHLLHLIDDVLDLSKIETGGVAVSIASHPVAGLLAEVMTTLEPTAEREGIQLQLVPVPPDVPAIEADRTRFVQVLLNFGSNAIKYNRPSGSVTFAVSLPGNDRVRVSVRDTGIGISADKQQKLFQPFQRAGQEMGPIEGTGIGLVITRRLAHLMHGEVGFESTPGEGSVFWVDMPAWR